MATDAAARAGFGKVGGITVEVQDHVTGAVSDGGVRVGRRIIEEPNICVTGFLRCFRFLVINGADVNKHGRVDSDSVVDVFQPKMSCLLSLSGM